MSASRTIAVPIIIIAAFFFEPTSSFLVPKPKPSFVVVGGAAAGKNRRHCCSSPFPPPRRRELASEVVGTSSAPTKPGTRLSATVETTDSKEAGDSTENEAANEAAKNDAKQKKVLILGGTGFVGQEILRQCATRSIPAVSTSTSGIGSTIAIDLTSPDASAQIEQIVREHNVGYVISTVGSIGTASDFEINSATAKAAAGAKKAGGVTRFVFVGNDPRIRGVTQSVSFLKDYAAGKELSEKAVEGNFGVNGTIIAPTFIYGGDEFGLSPPRVASPVGKIAEEVLGLYPIQAISKALPDALGAALEPPVSVESVAGAALNAALGYCEGYTRLETKDSIVMAAASDRPKGCVDEEECSIEEYEATERRREELKGMLLGKQKLESDEVHDDIALMEELELLRPTSTQPAYDARLNGKWNFVLSKSDLGTELIKGLTGDDAGSSPLKLLYDLKGVYMEITDEQSTVNIVLSQKVLGVPLDVVLTTSLLPMAYEDDAVGTMFVEKFEGIEIAGVKAPIPGSWQRSRYLEISYLDDEMLIARGTGGEPHFLIRG